MWFVKIPTPDDSREYLTIVIINSQYLALDNSTLQIWNLLVLFGITKTSSITGYIIPVSSRYCHDTVLTVLCLSGIITILILVILKKTTVLTQTSGWTSTWKDCLLVEKV